MRGLALPSVLALGGLFAAERAYHHEGPTASRDRAAPVLSQGTQSGERGYAEDRRAGPSDVANGVAASRPADAWLEQELAAQAEESREARERALSAPITDSRTVDLTGQTEAENMIDDREVEAFFGRPIAFAREVESRLGAQLRTGDRLTAEVDRARDAVHRVFVEEAVQAEVSHDLPRALNLLNLAGKNDRVAEIATRERRPGLAMGIWRRGAHERPDSSGVGGLGSRLAEQIYHSVEPGNEEGFIRELSSEERQDAVRYFLDGLADIEEELSEARESLAEAERSDPPLPASSIAYYRENVLRCTTEWLRVRAILRLLRA